MNKIRIAGAAAGVVLVSGMVLQVSSAAFTGETSSANNSWAAGTVTLSNNLNGSAMYVSQADITPGYEQTRCIEVTYTGSVVPPAPITFDAAVTSTAGGPTGVADNDGLANDLDVAVRVGASCSALTETVGGLLQPIVGAPAPLFTGKLSTYDANPRTTQWTPTGAGDKRAFSFTIGLPANTPNGAQGDSATANFTWSASS